MRSATEDDTLNEEEESIVYSQGVASFNSSDKTRTFDLKALWEACNQSRLSSERCYETFKAMGLDYGPSQQGIEDVYVGEGEALARLSLPSCVAATQNEFVLHPSLMGSALQASIAFALAKQEPRAENQEPFFPSALDRLEVYSPYTSRMWVLISYTDGSSAGAAVQKLDLDLCDDQGRVVVMMRGMTCQNEEAAPSTTSLDLAKGNAHPPKKIALFEDTKEIKPEKTRSIRPRVSLAKSTIASGCDNLVLESNDIALAGGVCVMAGPAMHIMTSKAGMLSSNGRCCPFDQRANGFVPGDGVGVILLKRLEDATKDGDRVYGVICGWGVNQDGKTSGLTAPNGDSQARLEKEIYEKYAIHPEEIQLIEAHGTGTQLGDPLEIEGLKVSFQRYTKKENYCALGSVKSNIGHLLAAAGVAGVIKILLSLKHRQLPPMIHYDTLNEHTQLKGSPFYVNAECKNWEISEGQKRRAAISSFGFSARMRMWSSRSRPGSQASMRVQG